MSEQSDVAAGERERVSRICECAIEAVHGPADAIEAAGSDIYDVVVGEFPCTSWTAVEWLEEIRRSARVVPVIIRSPRGSFQDAVRAAKAGAYDFAGGEIQPEQFARILAEAAEQRRACHPLHTPAGELPEWKQLLVGESRPMRMVEDIVRMIAPRRCTVLITGETGTGKEMAARAVHMASPRGRLPLVAVNCNALPDTLLEAELFGHVRGAFTGAITQRVGRFEQANRSTLFLDEIGDMPLDLQAKLLRVIQEREVQRLGSPETVRLDVRIVAASNADLATLVREGRFREDLYYRLNVVPVRMPALRERPSDIPLLANHFMEKICNQEGLPLKRITRPALDRLCACPWPGNVRQLENAVEMAIALSGDEETLYPGDFPLPSLAHWKPPSQSVAPVRLPDCGLDFERTVTHIERSILEQALERTGGNKKQAAEMLRLKRTTLSAKLKSLQAEAAAI